LYISSYEKFKRRISRPALDARCRTCGTCFSPFGTYPKGIVGKNFAEFFLYGTDKVVHGPLQVKGGGRGNPFPHPSHCSGEIPPRPSRQHDVHQRVYRLPKSFLVHAVPGSESAFRRRSSPPRFRKLVTKSQMSASRSPAVRNSDFQGVLGKKLF